jgi:hypothetical protein
VPSCPAKIYTLISMNVEFLNKYNEQSQICKHTPVSQHSGGSGRRMASSKQAWATGVHALKKKKKKKKKGT